MVTRFKPARLTTHRKITVMAIFLCICACIILGGLLTYDLQFTLAALILFALAAGTLLNRGNLFPYIVLLLFTTGNLVPMNRRFFPESALTFSLDGFLNIAVVFLSLIVLILNHNKLNKTKFLPFSLWATLLSFAFFSLLLTKYPGFGLKTIIRFLAPFLIGLVFIVRINDERDLRKFLTLFALLLLIPLGVGMLDLTSKFGSIYSGESQLYAQMASVFNHRGAFGMFLIVVTNLSFLCALSERRKFGYWLIFTFSIILILFNNTRVVWFSFLASFLALLFFKRNFKLIIVTIVLVFVAIQIFPNLKSRLGSIDFYDLAGTFYSSPELGTLRGRVLVWGSLLELLNSIVIGNGIGFVRYIFTRHGDLLYNVSAPHNEYLGLLMDLGLVGLGLFVLFYITLIRDLAKNMQYTMGLSHDMVILSLSLIVASLVFFITDNLIGLYTIHSFYWMFYGLGLSARTLSQDGGNLLPHALVTESGRRAHGPRPIDRFAGGPNEMGA